MDTMSRFEECPCSGATLDKLLQPAILTALLQGDVHGYRLVQQVAGMPLFKGRNPDVSGVYRSLRLMESRKLVVASWNLSERGPAKRLYRLTPAGRECLLQWQETLIVYREAIGDLLAATRKACVGASRRPKRRG
jgi:PadR family transcriptional regulator, regulatory protein PadR